MSKTLANCSIWLDTLRIDSQVNQVSIQASATEEDITAFTNPGMARLPGLKDGIISASGFWEANPDPDFTLFGDVGTNLPLTVALTRNSSPGDPAYLMCAQLAQYGGIGAKVGKALAFSLRAAQVAGNTSASGNAGRLAQGILAESRTVTTSGNGNIYGPLAVPSTVLARMVAALHLTAFSGTPTFTLSLQSASTVGMGSPTLRATFNAITSAVGSQILELAGPISDTYWQFFWTVSGGGPSVTFAASLGLAP